MVYEIWRGLLETEDILINIFTGLSYFHYLYRVEFFIIMCYPISRYALLHLLSIVYIELLHHYLVWLLISASL